MAGLRLQPYSHFKLLMTLAQIVDSLSNDRVTSTGGEQDAWVVGFSGSGMKNEINPVQAGASNGCTYRAKRGAIRTAITWNFTWGERKRVGDCLWVRASFLPLHSWRVCPRQLSFSIPVGACWSSCSYTMAGCKLDDRGLLFLPLTLPWAWLPLPPGPKRACGPHVQLPYAPTESHSDLYGLPPKASVAHPVGWKVA